MAAHLDRHSWRPLTDKVHTSFLVVHTLRLSSDVPRANDKKGAQCSVSTDRDGSGTLGPKNAA